MTHQEPGDGDQPQEVILFGPRDLFHVRGLVGLRGRLAGLSDERTHGLVLAVHEIAAYAFTLSAEPAWLLLTMTTDAMRCEIRETDDLGNVRPAPYVPRLSEPFGREALGWRLARLLTDEVHVTADGTSAQVVMHLDEAVIAPDDARIRRRHIDGR